MQLDQEPVMAPQKKVYAAPIKFVNFGPSTNVTRINEWFGSRSGLFVYSFPYSWTARDPPAQSKITKLKCGLYFFPP